MLGTACEAALTDVSLPALLSRPELQEACRSFLSSEPASYLPDTTPATPTLCLLQGEQATVDAAAAFPQGLFIGSQDATTCLVAVIWCPVSRFVWAAHLDQQPGQFDVQAIVAALGHMHQPCVHLCGGYCDAQGRGPLTAAMFLQLLHSLEQAIHLGLCCVGPANTAEDGSPCSRQLVLDTASGTVHPWLFSDRGPQLPRRFAAKHCWCDHRHTLVEVWCAEHQQLLLSPCDVGMLDSWQAMSFERMLRFSDEQLLAVMSTSPAHEPAWFCEDMRSMMRFLINAQEPDSPERQASSRSARFYWDSQHGQWQPAAAIQAAAATATAAAVAVAAAAGRDSSN